MGILDHLTSLLRNLYAGQEAAELDMEQCMFPSWERSTLMLYILPSCLFNLYAEYIVWNARLDEAQAGIKIAGRNINNLRYADDNTLMAENKEKLKSSLMKVKEQSEKAGLKFKTQKIKIMRSCPITSWPIDVKTMETVTNFIFLGSKITVDGNCSHEIKRCLLLGRKIYDKPRQHIKKQSY